MQTDCAAERVVHETPTPRLEQLVLRRAFAHALEPTTTVQFVPSVPRQSFPQQTSPQNGAGLTSEGVEPEHPM